MALKDLRPIQLIDGDQLISGPPMQVMMNLPILHRILAMTLDDWHRAVAPYEARINGGRENPELVAGQACLELHPAFLKSLFSYVLFFIAADQAYETVWESLRRLNKVARVDSGKKPRRTPLIQKAQTIRNWSIAHFPSKWASEVDRVAAMLWIPMALSKPSGGEWDLKELTFGGFRLTHTDAEGNVTQSRDLEVQGLDALHQTCMTYLDEFDSVCANFLAALHRKEGA